MILSIHHQLSLLNHLRPPLIKMDEAARAKVEKLLNPWQPTWYVFSVPTRIAAGARDSSRNNVSTAQTRPQNCNAFLARQHPCGLKSALRRLSSDPAKQKPCGQSNTPGRDARMC